MSDLIAVVSSATESTDGLRTARIGCCGKIPSRGDFVRVGLPRDFLDIWDGWFAAMLAASRAGLGEGWRAAWLEAPVWHFVLAPGVCGAKAAIGVWMPSVDRVGRYFPLTIAALADDATPEGLLGSCGLFLDAATQAGRAAVTADLSPDELMARIHDAAAQALHPAAVDASLRPASGALWWTSGAPRVAACVIPTAGLPDAETFLAMLDGSEGR